jgi:hypothetical protein
LVSLEPKTKGVDYEKIDATCDRCGRICAFLGVNGAAEAVVYNLDTACATTTTCGSTDPFGSVTVTGTSTALTYSFNVSDDIATSGSFTDLFMRILGTVTSATVSGFSGSVDSNGDDVGNGLFRGRITRARMLMLATWTLGWRRHSPMVSTVAAWDRSSAAAAAQLSP